MSDRPPDFNRNGDESDNPPEPTNSPAGERTTPPPPPPSTTTTSAAATESFDPVSSSSSTAATVGPSFDPTTTTTTSSGGSVDVNGAAAHSFTSSTSSAGGRHVPVPEPMDVAMEVPTSSFSSAAPAEQMVVDPTITPPPPPIVDVPSEPSSSRQEQQQQLADEVGPSSTTITAAPSGYIPTDPMKFHVDPELLEQVMELGFEEFIGRLAIERTRGAGMEAAVNWIIDHSNQSDMEEDEQEDVDVEGQAVLYDGDGDVTDMISRANDELEEVIRSIQAPSTSSTAGRSRTHKMVLVVNMSLKMGVGKLAAQVGHATLGVYRLAQKTQEGQSALNGWRNRGEVKIVVKGQSTEQLLDLFKQAKDSGLFAYLVQDAGYTQIPPGSRTVLATFGLQERVDEITGALKLL